MIWTLSAILLIVISWYWFEGRWDRRLFKTESWRQCVNVGPRDASAFLEEHPDTQLLDVRADAEFGRGRLPGAIHIPIKALELKLTRLDKGRPVLVYCAGGYRSRKAVEKLKATGFIHILNLHRGYHSWRLAGLPVEKDPPYPDQRPAS